MYKVYLKKNKESRILNGYSRVYANEVLKIEDKGMQGSICKVLTFEGKFVGYGYINHLSKIIVRMLTLKEEEINYNFYYNLIYNAKIERNKINATSYRAFFGESDGIPGLIVDKYEDYLVVQIMTLGIEKIKDQIVDILIKIYNPKGIYERSDMDQRLKEGLEKKKGYLYNTFNPEIIIKENGIKLYVDLENGQKTGYFLDQRENRENIKKYVKDLEVLDCFSNIGGFALNAIKGNAKFVTALDISSKAIEMINRNMELNNFTNYEAKLCDVFEQLRKYNKENKKFDFIILDPPAFTKNIDTVKSGYKGYLDINILALKLLKKGGYLVTCSCSEHMDLNLFLKMVQESARYTKSNLKLKEIKIQSIDHASSIQNEEALYLKSLVLYKTN